MSKKKTLLNENTIRRFMKLAEISPLTENYFENYGGINEEEEDEDPLADMGAEDAFGADDPGVAADVAVDEPGGEPELSPEDPASEANVETLVKAIMDTVEEVSGVPTSVEGGEEVEMDVDVPPEGGEEVEMDLGVPPEGGPPEGGDEGEPEDMLGEMLSDANIDLVDNNALVQEITKRVAKRLIRAKLASKR